MGWWVAGATRSDYGDRERSGDRDDLYHNVWVRIGFRYGFADDTYCNTFCYSARALTWMNRGL